MRYLDVEDKYCSNCGEKIKNVCYDILDDYNKSVIGCLCPKCISADWRIGNLDPKSSLGKGFIGQQIVAKTFGVEDCNLKTDNFHFYVDIDKYSDYGYIEVKTSSYSKGCRAWYFDTSREQDYDNLFLVCMDGNWPWKDVKRMYAIPWEVVGSRRSIDIAKKPSRPTWYQEFKIDEKHFNDTYHNMKLENCKILKK